MYTTVTRESKRKWNTTRREEHTEGPTTACRWNGRRGPGEKWPDVGTNAQANPGLGDRSKIVCQEPQCTAIVLGSSMYPKCVFLLALYGAEAGRKTGLTRRLSCSTFNIVVRARFCITYSISLSTLRQLRVYWIAF